MGSLEQQVRAIGFIISISLAFTLSYILYIGFSRLGTVEISFLIISILILFLCTIGQLKYYNSPGYTYTLYSLPSVFLVICLVIFS